jgi:hypothetical protein
VIISWFTEPPSSFASYYQYDTVTQRFSRIRLQLGRQSLNATNDTFVSSKPHRAVGFSAQRYSTSDPGSHWSVNEKGALCYDNAPLPSSKPNDGDRVYDSSDPSSFVHRGNAVTNSPELPAGIEPKHLALLANEALVTMAKITLTGPGASGQELAEAIKGEVCRILNVENFAAINDDMILGKLTSQTNSIRGDATRQPASSQGEALTAAEETDHLIGEQIEEGILTPNEAFETAFGSMQSALAKAQTAVGDANVRQALIEIGNAQQAVKTAIENIDAAMHEAVARQLDLVQKSLSEAQQDATEWQAIEEEYRPLAEADTVADYEREIGVEFEEIA